jgi:hypothetical protein
MSAVCPACGVAVVPGYVKCPKCQAALPRRPRTVAAGGTAVKDERFPLLAVAVPGAIVLVLLLVMVFGGDDDDDASDEPQASQPTTSQPVQTAQQPVQTAQQPDQPTTQTPPAGPDPRAAVAELERTLRRQRLWSTMDLAGSNLDVRSAMCDEAAMRTTIDGAAPSLRGAGLTRLRCLAQSGAVVFERDL